MQPKDSNRPLPSSLKKLGSWLMDRHPDLCADIREIVPTLVPVPWQPNTGEKRRSEYHAGRMAVRAALCELGIVNAEIEADENSVPIWPDAIIGSTSHTDRFAGAIVLPKKNLRCVGLDFEPFWQLDDQEANLVRRPNEKPHGPTINLFVAKEAAYKAGYPVIQSVLDFHDMVVQFSDDGSTFQAQVAGKAAPPIEGRMAQIGSIIVALAWINAKRKRCRKGLHQ